MTKPAGSFKLSVLEGGLLKIEVVPPNPEVYIELAKLPTKQMRPGAFCVAFWDLPGIQTIASAMRHTVELDAAAQDMADRWTRWCLELEYTKSFAEYPGFKVDGLAIDFLDFQARSVNYGVKIKSFLLGSQMGVGKSIIMLGILFTHRKALGGRLNTLILAPTSVVGDWRKKFLQFASVEVSVASGTPDKRLKVYKSDPEFLVMSYDTFLRDAAIILRHFKPKAVVADESQRITSRKSKATIKLLDFVDIVQPEFRIPMSGSPIANRPDDLWPILRMINPGLAGSAKAFEGRYLKSSPIWRRGADGKPTCKIEYGSGDKKKSFVPMKLESLDPSKPEDAKILGELKMKIAPFVIRHLKKDVLKNLPQKFHERIDIDLGAKERKEYEKLQAQLAEAMAGVNDEDVEGTVTNFLEWFIKAQQICASLEIPALGTESSKLKELKHFIEDHADDEKILIFSQFHEMTKLVVRDLGAYSPLHLHGGVPQKKRQGLVDAFEGDPKHRLFVSTLGAGGVGLTLTAASIVVRLDRWPSPARNSQAEDRAHRIGQVNDVTVVDFVVEDSVEERILNILEKKERMIASLISVDEAPEGGDADRAFLGSLFRRGGKNALLKLI